MLGLAVQRRLERGTTDEEVDELVARFKQDAGLIFTVDTLEYLAKGGRIGKAAAMAGHASWRCATCSRNGCRSASTP